MATAQSTPILVHKTKGGEQKQKIVNKSHNFLFQFLQTQYENNLI